MADERPRLTWEIIERLKKLGWSQAAIGRAFGVSRQYVSRVKRSQAGWSETPRERNMRRFPWKLGHPIGDQFMPRMVRDHLEFMGTLGDGMHPERLKSLTWFYRKLISEGLVVEYDPAIPPSEAATYGHFAWRKVRNSDGVLIVRLNRYTVLDEEAKVLFEFPPIWPDGQPLYSGRAQRD